MWWPYLLQGPGRVEAKSRWAVPTRDWAGRAEAKTDVSWTLNIPNFLKFLHAPARAERGSNTLTLTVPFNLVSVRGQVGVNAWQATRLKEVEGVCVIVTVFPWAASPPPCPPALS